MQLEQLSRNFLQVESNLDLDLLISDFLLSRRSSNYTEKTHTYYKQQLGYFRKWLSIQDISKVDQITPTTIRTYLLEKAEGGDKPTTNHARFRSIKTFLRWLENEEVIFKNPIQKVAAPKLPKQLLPPLSDDELSKVMASISKTRTPLEVRNAAIIYVLLDSGVRVEELLNLKIGQFNEQGSATILGKGQKERVVMISQTTQRILNKYLKIRGGQEGSPLWIGTRGPCTLYGLMEIIEKIGLKCGVHLNPHKFRRTFAVHCLKNGMNLRVLQLILGHSSIETTTKYLCLLTDDLMAAHVAASPVESLTIDKLKR